MNPPFDTVKVTLPFDAVMGAATVPAGDYLIRELENRGEGTVLEIMSVSGHFHAMTLAALVPTENTQPALKTEIVLRHDASKYVATAIWLQGRDYGFELPGAAR